MQGEKENLNDARREREFFARMVLFQGPGLLNTHFCCPLSHCPSSQREVGLSGIKPSVADFTFQGFCNCLNNYKAAEVTLPNTQA